MSTKSKSIKTKTDFNQDERLKKVSNLKILLNRPELGALGGAILVFIFSSITNSFIISLFSEELNLFTFGIIFVLVIFSLSEVSKLVLSLTFNISIGIMFGTKISLDLKKLGIPTANNKITKCNNIEKKIPELFGLSLSKNMKKLIEL